MGKKLFVGNLPFSASVDEITEIFSQAGKVDNVRIVVDKQTGRSKGFGFVEMSTDAEAADAIAKFQGANYEGRPLTVAEAKPQEGGGGGRPPRGGSGGGGRGPGGGGYGGRGGGGRGFGGGDRDGNR